MIGIVFATEMEARPWRERGVPEGTVLSICGMGMEAARTATEALIEQGCSTIVNAGVCGALSQRLKRGAVYRVASACTEHRNAAVNVGVGVGLKRLVTVDEPVFDETRRRALLQQGDMVDMEGYAIAEVCERHSIPCIMIKGVTDFGDENGKADIQKHIDPVSETVAEALSGIVESLQKTARQAASSTLMQKLHSFTKVEHTIFSLPLLFAGAWLGAGGMPALKTLLQIALVGLGARTFGMAVNRILDRKIDAKNPRTKERELPAGALSVGQGIGVAVVGLVLYFLGCALLGSTVLKLSLVPLIPLSLYSLLKRFTPLCHYGIGICLAAAPLGAFVAVSNSLSFTPAAWLLALFTFCWISGFDIIYALMDLEFDRANGVRSIPAALGERGALTVAALTHLLAFSALVLLWMGRGGALAFIALLISALGFGGAYIPAIPIPVRFFPISVIAGIAGAVVVMAGKF